MARAKQKPKAKARRKPKAKKEAGRQLRVHADTDSESDSDVDPWVCTPVEDLHADLGREVKAELKRVKTLAQPFRDCTDGEYVGCPLCPWRRWEKKTAQARKLESHLKYHKADRNWLADSQGLAQYHVAKSLFNHKRCVSVLPKAPEEPGNPGSQTHSGLLAESSKIMANWLADGDEAQKDHLDERVRKDNAYSKHVALAFIGCTGSDAGKWEPKYVLKSETGKLRLRRSGNTYYDAKFADLLLSAMLRGEERTERVRLELIGALKDPRMASLVPQRQKLQLLLLEIFELPEVKAAIDECIQKIVSAGLATALTHDATFKSLFSIEDQIKMDQKGEGEWHALHTFQGTIGTVLGLSPQVKEAKKTFAAAAETLPECVRDAVLYIFSDAPSSVDGESFKNLKFTCEDLVHLVLRLEACQGEARPAFTSEVF
jgi:hypothetical protein